MTGSQQTATAAALTELHIAHSAQVVVVQAEAGYPAYGVLKVRYGVVLEVGIADKRVVRPGKAARRFFGSLARG